MLVGGGSGGHFYPLIAVAERLKAYSLKDEQYELYYMGPEKYDESELENNNISFVYCPAGKKRRYFSFLNILDSFGIFFGFFVAIYKLYILYPDVVFSKGSATSVPVTLAAWLLKIPIVIHESDSKPGRANKLASKFATYIAISFDEVAEFFPKKKIALTGIPIRTAFMQPAENPHAELGIPSDKPVIFVTGGSLGAVRVNNLVLDSLDELLPDYTVVHQAGEPHAEIVQSSAASLVENSSLLDHYFVKGKLSGREMDLAQSAAVLIISRAGAGTIFEIAHKGIPSILIPIPEEISHDQRTNAYAYARAGAASVLEEDNLTDGLLNAEVIRIMSDEKLYRNMGIAAQQFAKNDAAEQLAATLISITKEHD